MIDRGLPILCLDFDGVIHDYRDGWKDGSIYGELTPGFKEWAVDARKYFTLIIHTSRARTAEGAVKVEHWLRDRDLDWLEVTTEKPPAFVTIDDRALTFKGDWSAFKPNELRDFRTWSAK